MKILDRYLDLMDSVALRCQTRPGLCRTLRYIGYATLILVALAMGRCAFAADNVGTCSAIAKDCGVGMVKATPDTLTFNEAGQPCWTGTAPTPCAFRKLSAMAPTDQVWASDSDATGKSRGSTERWIHVSELTIASTTPPVITSPPPIPTIKGVAHLTWDAPTGGSAPTGYRVYTSTDGATFGLVTTLAAAVRAYDLPITQAGTYTFAVTTLSGNAEGPQATTQAKAEAVLLPGAVLNLRVTISVTTP